MRPCLLPVDCAYLPAHCFNSAQRALVMGRLGLFTLGCRSRSTALALRFPFLLPLHPSVLGVGRDGLVVSALSGRHCLFTRTVCRGRLLVVSGLVVTLPAWIADTEAGWHWRVHMSIEALAPYAVPAHADVRQRVGMLLVDTQREPCPGQSWLWLGRPFGGGTGINLALVHARKTAVPQSPQPEAFRFLWMHGNWWLAYHNPDSYSAATGGTIVCVEGLRVASHAQGLRFIDSLH